MVDREKFRRLLERERLRLERGIEELERTGLDRSLGEAVMEFSTYDNHPADLGTETFEREKDIGLREDRRTTLDLIERALERLDSGDYGTCEDCGRPIDEARLEAVPWTARCVACQGEVERAEARDWERPSEEDVRPAFSSFTEGGPEDFVGFDGEDAWQAVARYGTSNTPGDFPGAVDYEEAYIDADERLGAVEEVETAPGPGPGPDGRPRGLTGDDDEGRRPEGRGRKKRRPG